MARKFSEKLATGVGFIWHGTKTFLYDLYRLMPCLGVLGGELIKSMVDDGYIDYLVFAWLLLPWIMGFVAWRDGIKVKRERDELLEEIRYMKNSDFLYCYADLQREKKESERLYNELFYAKQEVRRLKRKKGEAPDKL